MRLYQFMSAGAATLAFAALSFGVESSMQCSERADRSCEIRESKMAASQTLDVDAEPNGGIRVTAWEKNEIFVRAKVEAWSGSKQEQRETLEQIKVVTADRKITAKGPKQDGWLPGFSRHWSVSYEVMVPARIDLTMRTVNGGIHLDGVRGLAKLQTVNGGIDLSRVSGRVHAETVNGGVHAQLEGKQWDGEGLDVKTVNGGVTVEVPDTFNAELHASTVNGGLNSDFPGAKITKATSFGIGPKSLDQSLGKGGARIGMETVNGGVKVRRRTA